MLKLKKEPKKETYRKLIEYVCKECDTVLMVIEYNMLMNNIVRFDKICELTSLKEEDVFEEYNRNGAKNIASIIEKTELKEQFSENIIKTIINGYRKAKKEYIKKKRIMEKIKDNLKRDLILERHNPEWCGQASWFEPFNISTSSIEEKIQIEYQYKGEYLYDICFYKLSENVKEFLLQQGRLYKFLSPNLPEDICFFKNGKCWLKTTTHEHEGYIFEQSEREKEYLKRIGIKFEEYEISDENIPYEEYVINER